MPLQSTDLMAISRSGTLYREALSALGDVLIPDGSNANGDYAEFGPILVCWHTIALGSILAAGSGTDASPYRTGLASWTFPQAFSASPFFSVSFTPDSAIAIDARPMVPGPTSVSTTTLFNIRAHRLSSNAAATNVTAHLFAWGKG